MILDLISVIIPIYNTEKYLGECLDSVIAQTYTNIEILLINDGSTDASLEVCKKYENLDQRIRVIDTKNGGVSAARNIGIRAAAGKYITFIDSDDTIHPDTYRRIYNILTETGVDRVLWGWVEQYGNRQIHRKPRIPDGVYRTGELLPKMIDDGTLTGFLLSGVNDAIYLSKVIKENNLFFNEEVKFNEDGLFNLQYSLHTDTLYLLREEALYYYRIHDRSSTSKRPIGDKYFQLHKAIQSLSEEYTGYQFDLQLKRRMATVAMWDIMDLVQRESALKAIQRIQSILENPETQEGLALINAGDLNKYKSYFYKAMKKKQSLKLYFAFKYIVPLMRRIISR